MRDNLSAVGWVSALSSHIESGRVPWSEVDARQGACVDAFRVGVYDAKQRLTEFAQLQMAMMKGARP